MIEDKKLKTSLFYRPGSAPRLLLAPEVQQKIYLYTNLAETEVSGLGLADIIDDNIVVSELFIYKQVGSRGHTKLSSQDIAQLKTDLIRAGREADIKRIRFWFHSHHQNGVMWSPTDNDNIRRLLRGWPWVISLVSNQAGEQLARFDFANPELTLNELPIFTWYEFDAKLVARLRDEVAAKVTIDDWRFSWNFVDDEEDDDSRRDEGE